MILKILGSGIFILCSTYLGFYYGNKLIKRINELNEIERLGVILENEIVYSHTHLPEALFLISHNQKDNIENLFYKIYEKLNLRETDSVSNAFEEAVKENKNTLNLTNEDIKVLLDFGNSLGDYDIEGYKKVFALFKMKLSSNKSEAEIKKNKNLKVYKYLGFSIGAMVVIMMV